ncbi:hypothetical protein Ddc_11437 [Ditylenchus destructor]|nr:hypothetical protein Ddc_11437 [Ditylenchus destructor]
MLLEFHSLMPGTSEDDQSHTQNRCFLRQSSMSRIKTKRIHKDAKSADFSTTNPLWIKSWQIIALYLATVTSGILPGASAEICSTTSMTSVSGSDRLASAGDPPNDSSAVDSSPGASPLLGVLRKPVKLCPDFKDDVEQNACCRSRITQGAFYCCTQEQKEQLQWEEHKQQWKSFFQSHTPELVIAFLVLAIVACFMASFLCKRLTFCPMYKQAKLFDPIGSPLVSRFTSSCDYPSSRGGYRRAPPPPAHTACDRLPASAVQANPTTVILPHSNSAQLHKPLGNGVGEAPPPYEVATSTGNPHRIISSNEHRHGETSDWNCLIENELNRDRIRQGTAAGNSTQTTTIDNFQ